MTVIDSSPVKSPAVGACSAIASVRPRPDGQGLYTISEVAAFTGLRAHTLRWYEQIALMRQVDWGSLTGPVSDAGKELSGGDVRQLMPRFNGDDAKANAALLAPLHTIAAAGATVAQIVLAWVQQRAQVHGLTVVPIPGTRRRGRLLEHAGATRITLGADELALLEPIAGQVAGERYADMSLTSVALGAPCRARPAVSVPDSRSGTEHRFGMRGRLPEPWSARTCCGGAGVAGPGGCSSASAAVEQP